MIPPYIGYVALAVLLPVAVLAVWAQRRRPHRGLTRHVTGIVIITGLALVYTTPWDNAMIARGVWSYGEGVVLDRIWEAPYGEYLFIASQPWLTGLWLYHVDYADPIPDVSLRLGVLRRVAGVLGAVALAGLGVAIAMPLDGPGLYLGTLLAWAAPVFALQWTFGWSYLWRQRSVMLSAITVPTVYLWIVDAVAIRRGLWTIERRLGPEVVGLPLEELAFFAVTNLIVVQGLMLWYWLVDRVERRR